jgi:hypothetical protein
VAFEVIERAPMGPAAGPSALEQILRANLGKAIQDLGELGV